MGMGLCPLKAAEVAIFPVRYAVDESPEHKGSHQGPNPLPKGWSSNLPPLQTRSYTLRQLRDGWLYVWNSIDRSFHEYEVKDEQFIRHPWTEAQISQDVRHNPSETHPYLLYPRRSQLRIAYSPVQWTWRLCELMRSHPAEHAQWMRELDLPAFCTTMTAEHGGMISELGACVADIFVQGATAPSFTSTMLPTVATSPDVPFKPAFEECWVRGKVPDQDTALFVALDDPLAIVDDLSMSLAGRLLELEAFEKTHKEKLHSACVVQNLCGFDAEAFIPSALKDHAQRQAYTDDLYRLLRPYDEVEHGKRSAASPEEDLAMLGATHAIARAEAMFQAKWGHLPERARWHKAREDWNHRYLWREDVRFEEVQGYLSQTTVQAQRLLDHCQRSEQDLLTWLDGLGPSAEALFHDTCNEGQSTALLETSHGLYQLLASHERGQRWLCQQASRPSTLFGLALFNFNAELAALNQTVVHNYVTYGTLDAEGRKGDGSTPQISLASATDATNVATRANEIKAVLDLPAVQNSTAYKIMSSVAKESMATLIKVANNHAREAWHGLSAWLLPAMNERTALNLVLPQVLISTEISSATQLMFSPTYKHDYQAWMLDVTAIQKKASGVAGALRIRRGRYDRHAARVQLRALNEELDRLFLRRPNLIIAKASGYTRLNATLQEINGWLTDFRQSEINLPRTAEALRTYFEKTKAWANRYLGQALPTVVVGLNLWNVAATARQVYNDGRVTPDEWRTLGANAAYAANAVAALWVGPAWHRAGLMVAELEGDLLKLAKAGYRKWLREVETAVAVGDSAKAVSAKEFALVSKGLILRTVTWAAFGAVAAGLEAWQLSHDVKKATSVTETALLEMKFNVVSTMFFASGLQLLGAGLGYWFTFSWVMSTPLTIAIAILGVLYLWLTMRANRYKREGLRLWLYRCTWGREPTPEWVGDKGHARQIQALLEILQQPTVLGKALAEPWGRGLMRPVGFWVQVQLPAVLAGKTVTLQPALITGSTFSDDQLLETSQAFYEQFLQGNWIDPKRFGQLPDNTGLYASEVDFSHTGTEEHRLYQVWIETPASYPIVELEVKYPVGVLQHGSSRGYIFRLVPKITTSEADRANTPFSGELKDEDGIVLHQQKTYELPLIVPV
jgi:hypothetical protein